MLPEKEYFAIDEVARRWNCESSLINHYFETGKLLPSIKFQDLEGELWEGEPGVESNSHVIEQSASISDLVYIWQYNELSLVLDEEFGCQIRLNGAILAFDSKQPTKWLRVAEPGLSCSFLVEEDDFYITRGERDRFEREYNIQLHVEQATELEFAGVQLSSPENYVDPSRIAELQSIDGSSFDLRKLIRFCEEVNIAFKNQSFFSIAMLTRAIIDHVPPIFKCSDFGEVTNNYGGARSFKKSMQHLDKSSRNIADNHLHCQIRKNESLPTFTQVNFSNDLDVLLAEIITILK